ncbi:MAG TPA: DUF3488 and transglutaminase-like domain-containing protein [Actinomycetota bacterium]|nr:DUF3488 and transglutaminase-like domain-containing protein [Actinomycetota bacterium]
MTREGESRVTLALALVAATCIYAFSRVFTGRAWLIPALGAAVGSIALTRWLAHLRITLRRSSRGGTAGAMDGFVATLAVLAVGGLVVLAVVFPSDTTYGIPTFHTVHAALNALHAAGHAISTVVAPVDPTPGFLAMAMATAWVAGVLSAGLIGAPSNWRQEGEGADSLSSSLVAPLPWLVLFTVAAGVGQSSSWSRVFVVGLFFLAVLLYLLAEGWRASTHLPKLDGLIRLGALSLVGALVLPNIIPGYRAGPVFSSLRVGPSTETVINPLVSIKPMLLNQTNQVMFRVQANAQEYWRLTSLDLYDGTTWTSKGQFNPSGGVLSSPPPGLSIVPVQQHYRVASLTGAWVPAAFVPTKVSGIPTAYDADTSALIVQDSGALAPGNHYSVSSDAPEPTGYELQATGAASSSPSKADLDLPASARSSIGPIAAALVSQAGASTAYEDAVVIQDWLRSPAFTYDESVQAGSSSNYLLNFLTVTRRGYCEQFAGAMAVMLRTLGIPARVAVGFLPGQQAGTTAGGLTSYTVTGNDAHAWPEAYFSGIGWVAFEPTPRQGAVPPPYTIAAPPVQNPTPTPAATEPGTSAQPTTAPAATTAPVSHARQQPATPKASHPLSPARRAADDLILALIAAVALLVGAREARLRLPARLARTPRERAIAIYDEFRLRAGDAASPKRPGETAAEYGRSVVERLGLAPGPVTAVTEAYEQAIYRRQGPAETTISAAATANAQLRKLIWRRAGWPARIRLIASPRPLFTRLLRPLPEGSYELRATRSAKAPSAARRST